MEKPTIFLLFFFITITFTEAGGYGHGNAKLFLFGDSFLDTGNTKPGSICWKFPYGMTVPGFPSGRFSNGNVLTDYLAQFLLVDTPPPYKKNGNDTVLDRGVNFAHGGTGVFDTLINEPNMTTQIDLFVQLLEQHYKRTGGLFNISSAVAVLSVSGNDYTAFVQKHYFKIFQWSRFSDKVTNQIANNILRLQGLGVKMILVTGLGPIGCYPIFSFLRGYRECAGIFNQIPKYHNRVLLETLKDITIPGYTVMYLNMYDAYMDMFDRHPVPSGGLYEACCDGPLFGMCGTTDSHGHRKYGICEDPVNSLFWDRQHLTNSGWFYLFDSLSPSLSSII